MVQPAPMHTAGSHGDAEEIHPDVVLRPFEAFVFLDPRLPSGNEIQHFLTESEAGPEGLTIWLVLLRIAAESIPEKWLVDRVMKPIGVEEVFRHCHRRIPRATISAVMRAMLKGNGMIGVLGKRSLAGVADLTSFILDECVQGPGHWASSADLLAAYRDYFRKRYETEGVKLVQPLTVKRFYASLLEDFGYDQANFRKQQGRRIRSIEGVSLRGTVGAEVPACRGAVLRIDHRRTVRARGIVT